MIQARERTQEVLGLCGIHAWTGELSQGRIVVKVKELRFITCSLWRGSVLSTLHALPHVMLPLSI